MCIISRPDSNQMEYITELLKDNLGNLLTEKFFEEYEICRSIQLHFLTQGRPSYKSLDINIQLGSSEKLNLQHLKQ